MSAHRIPRLLVFLASALLLNSTTPSHASDSFWNNNAGGSFNDPANWVGGLVPGPSDNAFFGACAFTYPVTFPANISNTQLTINKSNGTFDLLTHEYHLSAVGNDLATAPIRVGAQIGDNASLRVTHGILSGSTTLVGWVNGIQDYLEFSTGATLNSPSLDIGRFGIGHLTIDSGAIANSANTILAADALGQAFLLVHDAGTRWTNSSSLIVGDAGRGVISVYGGASATTASDAFLGFASGSTGSITVSGTSNTDPSALTVKGKLDVATSGTAFLSILNWGEVISGPAFVARSPGSNGTVKVTDNFAYWQTPILYIGGDDTGPGGTGLVNIANSGDLVVTGPITVWPTGTLQAYPVGITTTQLRLRGGKFSAWGNFGDPINSAGGTIEVPGSKILIFNGSLTSIPSTTSLQRIGSGDLWINGAQSHAPGATFQARGGKTFISSNAGAPATATSPATSNLTVIVGPEPATITVVTHQILHQLTVNAASPGRQSVDLDSPTGPGAFHSLSIYTPESKPDLWAAISNANRAGAPDPQDGILDSHLSSHPTSGIGLAQLIDAHGDPYLLIRPTKIGDLNLDGAVTIADFLQLSSHFNESGSNITWQEGDLNYDNVVTIADFIDLAANFGASYAGSSLTIPPSDLAILSDFASSHGPSSVPEPATSLLLAATLLIAPRLLGRSRRESLV